MSNFGEFSISGEMYRQIISVCELDAKTPVTEHYKTNVLVSGNEKTFLFLDTQVQGISTSHNCPGHLQTVTGRLRDCQSFGYCVKNSSFAGGSESAE